VLGVSVYTGIKNDYPIQIIYLLKINCLQKLIYRCWEYQYTLAYL
jgi:hypothetical protein